MKKIIVVAFEVDGGSEYEGLSNQDIIDLYKSDTWDLIEDINGEPFDLISVHDTVEDKADADETGTTTGTPELDEGPTG